MSHAAKSWKTQPPTGTEHVKTSARLGVCQIDWPYAWGLDKLRVTGALIWQKSTLDYRQKLLQMLDAFIKGILSWNSLEHRPPPLGTKHEHSIHTPQQTGADNTLSQRPASSAFVEENM
ncbi:MAG: hypothetical protein ACRDCF_01380, partial [Mycoplasmoidaceae bacterium]